MTKTINAVDARRTLGQLLNRVSIAHEEIVIERAGKKIAKLVSCEEEKSVAIGQGQLDFRTSAGLGKEIWEGVNVDSFVASERQEWE